MLNALEYVLFYFSFDLYAFYLSCLNNRFDHLVLPSRIPIHTRLIRFLFTDIHTTLY